MLTGRLDPSIGQAAGFGGVILHGLSTFGFAARALLSTVGANDPTALKFYGVRFTSPVKPGDPIETSAWDMGPGPDGTTEIAFEVKNLNSGKVRHHTYFLDHLVLIQSQIVIGNGLAYICKAEKSKL